MKLQARYNRITIFSTFFILLVAAACYYVLLRYVLTSQLDTSLKVEEAELMDYVKRNHALPPPTVYRDQRISYERVAAPVPRHFESLDLFDSASSGSTYSRRLRFTVHVANESYLVSISKSGEATEDLIWIILLSTSGLIILLSLILFFTNRFFFKKLWQPFRETLASIRNFNIAAPAELVLPPTRTEEFNELNENIRSMAKKVMQDYRALQDFTDHASHEMQTPLAIIRSRLDVLIQDPQLGERSLEQVHSIYKAVDKLSRLCQSLLLLARIDNNQYAAVQVVLIDELVREKMEELQDWVEAADIDVSLSLETLSVQMNRQLAEMMVSNLLRNAIRHNKARAPIIIRTTSRELMISNAGDAPLDAHLIFERFYKAGQAEGSGLGLAIVQKICMQYGYTIRYEYVDHRHQFTVVFIRN